MDNLESTLHPTTSGSSRSLAIQAQGQSQPRPRRTIGPDVEPPTEPNRNHRDVVRRDVVARDVAANLRGMLGLDPDSPASGELAASFDRPLPPLVLGLDAGGWIAWCLVGLLLFGGDFPSLALARHESKRVVLVLAMLRGLSISEAARLTGMSRKNLRDGLSRAGLYPWPEALRRALALTEKGEVTSCEDLPSSHACDCTDRGEP